MAELVRNLKTEVVHLPECPRRGGTVGTWNYAAGKSLADITADTFSYPWLHLCRSCLPGACRCGKCAQRAAA